MEYRKPLMLFCLCGQVIALSVVLVIGGWTMSRAAERTEVRGVGQFTIPSWFKTSFLDLREDLAEATASRKRLFVYFGQEGCPYCAALFNTNFSQKHIVDYTRAHFDAIELNIWGDREATGFDGRTLPEKEFAAALKVRFTPTILLFDEQGKQVLRINGYYPPHEFLAALQYVGEHEEGKTNFRDYLAARSPAPARGVLHPQPFFASAPHKLNRNHGKPIAVFFEQKDCAGCDQLHREVLQQPETLKQLAPFHVVQLDRWSNDSVVTPAGKSGSAREFADALNVTYVPTVVLFDKGREVMRVEAMLKGFHLQSVLDYVASGAYRQQPNFQRFLRERSERLRERGGIVDLWK